MAATIAGEKTLLHVATPPEVIFTYLLHVTIANIPEIITNISVKACKIIFVFFLFSFIANKTIVVVNAASINTIENIAKITDESKEPSTIDSLAFKIDVSKMTMPVV